MLLLASKASPSEMGLYGIVRSLFSLLEFSHLGSRFGLDIVLPNESNKINNRFSLTVISLSLWISLLLSIVLTVLYLNFYISIYLFASIFYYLCNNVRLSNRGYGNTDTFVKQSILINILPIASQIIFYFILGFPGIFYGFVFGSSALFYFNKIDFISIIKFKIIKDDFFLLQKKGMSLFITSLLLMTVVTLDRIFVSNYLGKEFTGFFTFISLFISSFSILPNSLSELLISSVVSNANDSKKVRDILVKNSLIIGILTFIAIIACFFILGYVVSILFPKYLVILPELKLSLLFVLPAGLVSLLQYYLIANNGNKEILFINIVSFFVYYIFLFVILNYSAITNKLFYLIVNKVIYSFLYFILIALFVFKKYKQQS